MRGRDSCNRRGLPHVVNLVTNSTTKPVSIMRTLHVFRFVGLAALLIASISGSSVQAQLSDITQPGDPIVASSTMSPGSEGVANAIDDQPTKYLNFDKENTGFTVTPSVGATLVTGLTLTSANDAPERDPASYLLEGSLDGISFFEIASNSVPLFPARFFKQYFVFAKSRAYKAYRLTFPDVTNPTAANSMQISEVEFLGVVADLPQDVTQPGDPIVASSTMSPGSEGVANAIDDQPTKYLNFDKLNTGFTVTPKVGLSVVQCLTLTSANDAPERDPASYLLEGSYDGTNFTQIASNSVPLFTNRFEKIVLPFDPPNNPPYLIYRLTFPTVANAAAANSMQISEVELLGFLAPTDVTQPGDPIVASSTMSPGSEGVANAIDNQPTKYLNFDKENTGFTVTPSVGATLVTGLTLTSANDAPERDPASYLLEGSLDGISFFEIASNSVPLFPARFFKQYFFFANSRAYKAYRLTFPDVANPTAANSMQISEVEFLGVVADLPQDVTQPGDPIVASSTMSPGSEGVANAIDDQPTKYLNFDKLNTGFTVSPVAGLTLVSGLTLTSANDAPERDPASFTLEGAYDGTNFTLIASGDVPLFTNRFEKLTFLFDNSIPYLQYRVTFPTVANAAAANSMQISEVELLGVLAPTDVTVPGDPIVASSTMSPGSEGVANAIDNQPTKYLNFDKVNTGFTVTPNVGDTIVSGLVLTSANDAPERDPASYDLSGSYDGLNFFPIASGPVPPFPSRFYKNYIFFQN